MLNPSNTLKRISGILTEKSLQDYGWAAAVRLDGIIATSDDHHSAWESLYHSHPKLMAKYGVNDEDDLINRLMESPPIGDEGFVGPNGDFHSREEALAIWRRNHGKRVSGRDWGDSEDTRDDLDEAFNPYEPTASPYEVPGSPYEPISHAAVEEIQAVIRAVAPDIDATVHHDKDKTVLSHLQARKGAPAGSGTNFMRELTKWADRHNRLLVLQTANKGSWGGSRSKSRYKSTTSSERLRRFYSRFGFVSNYGHRSYRADLPGNMHREPKG